MAKLADLYDFTLPFLPGAEMPLVDLHLVRALREFFRRTTVWREQFAFDTVADTPTYLLQPSQGAVASTLAVYLGGNLLPPSPEDRRDHLRRAQRPVGWYALTPEVIHLYPAPNGVYPVEVYTALTIPQNPDTQTQEFPDAVFDEHAEAIAAGAIAGMMFMPGKPWSKAESAREYSRVFGGAMRETRGKLRDGGMPNVSTFTAGRRFGV